MPHDHLVSSETLRFKTVQTVVQLPTDMKTIKDVIFMLSNTYTAYIDC